jgi:hypothetical protein
MSSPAESDPGSGHPGRDVLCAFRVGKLPEDLQQTVADHLGTCAECLALLEQLEDGDDPLLAELRQPLPFGAFSRPAATAGLTQVCSTSPPDGQDSSAAQPPPRAIGRYRILQALGSGGMGTVYKAHDPQLDRAVAVKVPHFRRCQPNGAVAVQRFLREARAAARIRHPHICPIHDVGEQDDTPYLVMAHIEGTTLAERLQGGRLDIAQAVALAHKVALGLQAVHAKGVIHRDLKPGNILLDAPGEPLLTDFGLARGLGDSEHLTQEDAVLGTPAYMAPEQAAGKAREVGPPADVWAPRGTVSA